VAPAQHAGVVVLTNMEGADANNLAKEILKIVAGKPSDEKERKK
jgi:hypothetical protein